VREYKNETLNSLQFTLVNYLQKTVAGISHLSGKCEFESALRLLGQKHVLSMLRYVSDRNPAGFNELQQALGVNRRTLSQRLRGLVAEGLLERKELHQIPRRVHYSLTPKGLELVGIFRTIRTWNAKYEKHAARNIENGEEVQATLSKGSSGEVHRVSV